MNKFVSGATCAAGVALAWQNDVVWVAFPGGGGLGAAAPNYKLNIMPIQPFAPNDAWSFDRLTVLENETTSEQPALTSFNGQLWLAWTGQDGAHRLNLLPFGVSKDNRLTKGTQNTMDWTATGGPSLLAHNSRLYLAFSGGGGLGGAKPNGSINVAFSGDGIHWPQSQLAVLSNHSLLSPSLTHTLGPAGQASVLYLAFTGTNNLIYATNDFGRTLALPCHLRRGGFRRKSSSI